MISSTKGIVKINQEIYFTTSNITENFIYTTARNQNSKIEHQKVFEFDKPKNASQLLKKYLQNDFNKEVKIVKNIIGIPKLIFHNEVLPNSLSLTHHGNFGAYIIS